MPPPLLRPPLLRPPLLRLPLVRPPLVRPPLVRPPLVRPPLVGQALGLAEWAAAAAFGCRGSGSGDTLPRQRRPIVRQQARCGKGLHINLE